MVMLTANQFATDRIIVVAFPPQTGGKFLINSLGLSRNAVLQHCDLTELTSNEKLDLLCDRYDSIHNLWKDIGLGCVELFGVDHSPGSPMDQEYLGVIVKLIEQQKYFFLVAHDPAHLACVLNIWPNAKVIYFTNCRDFILSHRWLTFLNQLNRQVRALRHWWKKHSTADWPQRPPCTIIEFQKPEYQQIAEQIKSIESLMLGPTSIADPLDLEYQLLLGSTNCNIRWDVSCYLTWEQYRLHIEMLYEQLGFDDFDSGKIRRLYDCWISAMQRHLHYLIDHC